MEIRDSVIVICSYKLSVQVVNNPIIQINLLLIVTPLHMTIEIIGLFILNLFTLNGVAFRVQCVYNYQAYTRPGCLAVRHMKWRTGAG